MACPVLRCFGVNRQELQSSIDAALTFGILWLDLCRATHAGKLVVEGLKLFVPDGCSALVRERMSHLNRFAAKWQLYELEERNEEVKQMELSDLGNISTRLVHAHDPAGVHARFAAPVALIKALMPEVEVGIVSPADISFRCHGLEFARARLSGKPGTFLASLKSSSEPAPANECSMAIIFRNWSGWSAALAKSAIPRVPARAVGGGCILSAGSSRW